MMNDNIDSEPLVSVLMTVYNREKYIAEAIESVLNSTYRNFELIIVDDLSTDNSLLIAKSYEEKDRRISVYKNEKNLQDYPNRNKAASSAKGKYLKFLDSDDKIYDWGLAYCVEQMEKYPQSSFGLSMLDGDESSPSIIMKSEEVIRKHFFDFSHLSTGPTGTIIKRDFFEKIQGYDTRFYMANDLYFNIKIATLTPVVLLKRLFFFYRLHENQEQNNPKGYLIYGFLVKREIIKKLDLPLKKHEIKYLKKKFEKEQLTSLAKHVLVDKEFKDSISIMKATNFGVLDVAKGLFYKLQSLFTQKVL
jgi:glycosyltransferase involved in cell wall biosynthesis